MNHIEQLIYSRDQTLERMVLCGILTSKRIPVGVVPEMFLGEERKLFDDLWLQWTTNGEVEPEILVGLHAKIVYDVSSLSPQTSQTAVNGLKSHFIRRGVGGVVQGIDPSLDALQMAQNLQSKISQIALSGSTEKEYNHRHEIATLFKTLEREATKDRAISGYSVGLPDFDSTTNGIELSKFYILAALKKTGKSRFMVHMAVNLASSGLRCLINSLEMSRTQLLNCALAYYSGINSAKLGTKLDVEDYRRLESASTALYNTKWCIYREQTVPDLRARIIQENFKGQIGVVFIDFIQRMHGVRHHDRTREVEEVSMDIADLSRELNVAVIALCQLSGEAERLDDGEIPNMSHVKESQGIAENADTIIIMHNPDRKKTRFVDGKYVNQHIQFRVEQRYGLSGYVCDVSADLRCCQFFPRNKGNDF